jgi:subtilase family serine protease
MGRLMIGLLLWTVSAATVRAQMASPTLVLQPAGQATPAGANGASPFTPAQIQKAYGIDTLQAGGSATGAGQTIAIIDAGNYPNALATLNYFSSYYGLPQFSGSGGSGGSGGPTFTQLNETGGTTLPPSNALWAGEEALDIEWAHVFAPNANIILYEAASASSSDLQAAVTSAKNNAAVSVVSMSYTISENFTELGRDSIYTTPAARLAAQQGVTFLASTGDHGAPGGYPAFSPNVVAVGGTSLYLNTDNSRQSESAWSNGGGGISSYESQPTYQASVPNLVGLDARATPDVSLDADPNTAVLVYDTYDGADSGNNWFKAGGTSVSCPCWAGLIADADQLRAADGYGTLDGLSQTLPGLYSLPGSDFHDITTGNNGYPAGAGYDQATGLGTPVANLLVPDLAVYGAPEPATAALLALAGMLALGRRSRQES